MDEAQTKTVRRRSLSGIYIFEQFMGEKKRQPTCVEDCTGLTRHQWLMALSEDALHRTIERLYDCVIKIVEDPQLAIFSDDEAKDQTTRANMAEHFTNEMTRTKGITLHSQLVIAAEHAAYKLRQIGDICDIIAK